jgi:CRP/FNR family transcriptional regulator, cyclic AMP receptor protein
VTPLVSAARSVLLSSPEVTRLGALRRSTTLFSQGQLADSVYYIDEGLLKLTRRNETGGRIILTIRGPGHLVGEEALAHEGATYYTEADVLTTANIFRIPNDALNRAIATSHEFAAALISYLLERRLALAEKVELLCLHDVEYRILHYLAELSTVVKPIPDAEGYQLPITQLELADLIGATRETTSTTLNQLERRGLLKLSRRMLTVPSPETLRHAAAAKVNGSGGAGTTVAAESAQV